MIDIQDVPDRWSVETVNGVCEYIQRGKQPEYDDKNGRIKIINQRCIYWDSLRLENIRKLDQDSEEDWQEYRYLQYGDVLVNSTGEGTLGRVQIWDIESDEDYVVDGHVTVLRSGESVVPEYLFRFLSSPLGQNQIKKYTKGSTGQTELYKKHITDIELPLPSLDEQKRIVEVVEERLERVRQLQKSVENIGRLTKEYRNSLIEYLFIGREDMSTPSPNQIPTEEDVPDNWEVGTIGEISSQIRTGGTPKKSRDDFWGGDIPWKASKHFNQDSLQLIESSEYVTDKGKNESTMAHPDDVVIVCRGAHTGKVGLVQSKFLFNQDVKVIRLPDSIHSEFVAHYLSNHMEYFLQKQRGGTTKGITTDHVKNLSIPIPPIKKQREVVNELKSIEFSRVSKTVSDVSTHFDEYRDSVLVHAFDGQIEY